MISQFTGAGVIGKCLFRVLYLFSISSSWTVLLQSNSLTILQSNSLRVLQSYSTAVPQSCILTVLQSYSPAVLQSDSLTALQYYSLAVLQSCSLTILHSYSPVVFSIYLCRLSRDMSNKKVSCEAKNNDINDPKTRTVTIQMNCQYTL